MPFRAVSNSLKKASVDPAFKSLLLTRRAEAAAAIDLTLEPSEVLMLQSATVDQLKAVIARTNVPQEHRRAFLGQAAVAMLAAPGTMTLLPGCNTTGTNPDRPPKKSSTEAGPTRGTRPDTPPSPPQGIRPDIPPEATKGIRPDRPSSPGLKDTKDE